LVNAFLDGTVDKETYLRKKDELIKVKTDLSQKKIGFGQKGKLWVEPLKSFLESVHNAEKFASSKDFGSAKSLLEKIGTNRILIDKKSALILPNHT
jgi:hypothetical protein